MTQRYLTKIELQKETMRFNAGHTTIFSATERERLHGHMYSVYLGITTWVEQNGMKFDYRYYHKRILSLIEKVNQTFLMPLYSPYLEITQDEEYYYFKFNGKTMPFLKEDITLMPLTNITVEELSKWFVEELVKETDELNKNNVEAIEVKVFSAPGQSANHIWQRPKSS
jgi:6-pyruvoyltetrahydropterin/6-carboxytetrahydropterin synthase